MFERDLLFRELEHYGFNRQTRYEANNKEYETPQTEDPNTILTEAALLPFSVPDRKSLYINLLSKDDNLSRTKANNSLLKNNKIFGVDILNIKKQLTLYVDFDIIETAIKQLRTDIVITTDPVNAVFTEVINQFQAKIFTDYNNADFSKVSGSRVKKLKEKYSSYGVITPSIVASLGFVFHTNKVFKSTSAKRAIKDLFKTKSVKESIEDYKTSLNIPALSNITGDNWYDYIINPSLLGWRGNNNRGFHLFLVLAFRKAETNLYKLLRSELSSEFNRSIKGQIHGRFSDNVSWWIIHPMGRVSALLGKILEIKQHHADTRSESPSTPKSFHLSGLAIDINYDTNPWVKGSVGLELLKKAAPTLVTTKKNIAQSYFAELALQNSTGNVYDILSAINTECKAYLTRIRERYVDWGFSTRPNGRVFLDHRKELVEELRDNLGLAWGAVDIGTGDMGNGDMMHFDLRPSVIGQAFFKAAGKSNSIDYLKTVHPHLRPIKVRYLTKGIDY